MACFEQFSQFIGEDVGIDLRCRNIGMAEQSLHTAQVRAALKQVGCIGVTQGMGMDARDGEAGIQRKTLKHLAKTATGEVPRLAA